MRRITLYTKPGCQLCDEALDLLLCLGNAMEEKPIIDEVNILEAPELYARYRNTVPVIAVDKDASRQILYAPISAAALRAALDIDFGCSDDTKD
jgi:glutaredoxin